MAEILCLPCRAEAGIASAQSRPLVSWRQTYFIMRGNSWSLIDGDGNVIPFRPRDTASRSEFGLVGLDTRGEELRKYRSPPESDADYRHRMLVNCLATIVVMVLIVTGNWMVDTIVSSWPR
jgi:hypothetical protein